MECDNMIQNENELLMELNCDELCAITKNKKKEVGKYKKQILENVVEEQEKKYCNHCE
jgi:hypothetical protein